MLNAKIANNKKVLFVVDSKDKGDTQLLKRLQKQNILVLVLAFSCLSDWKAFMYIRPNLHLLNGCESACFYLYMS